MPSNIVVFNPQSVKGTTEQMRHVLEQGSSSTQQKSLPASKMRCTGKSVPLVRNMTNIPRFLQRVEKENSIQEKALNFGVLDWKHLEKWKYMERMPGKHHKKPSVSGSSLYRPPEKGRSSGRKTDSHFSLPQRQCPPPASSHLSSSKKERNAPWDKIGKNIESIMPNGREGFNREYQAAKNSCTGLRQDHLHPKFGVCDRGGSQTNVEKKSMDNSMNNIPPRKEFPSSLQKICRDEIRFTSQCCVVDSEIPKDFSSGSGSSQSNGSGTSFDEVAENRLSDFFSPQEGFSTELSADIPHSCPLSSSAADLGECVMEQYNEIPSDTSPFETSLKSERMYQMMKQKPAKASSLLEGSRMLPDITEETSKNGRAPSPAHRFSFSLGRMSRSASLKERSEVPQLSSPGFTVRSGPLGAASPPSIGNIERVHADSNRKGRSSPLRRLLDPLLKRRTGQSAETVVPVSGSLLPTIVKTTAIKGPSQNRKPEVAKFQALLQLSFKNGLPFFKLVVENSKDMLAASVELPASGKPDPSMTCTFYSISEIRKKSISWISQGSNSKACRLRYTIVGQMKISNYSSMNVSCRDSGESRARKCVLYGIDPATENNRTVDFIPDREIAAIIIGDPSNKLNLGKDQCGSGTVVILPGGIHGIPVKGAPSSLISRWESGSCDCGGWDVGCKLRILADDNISHRNIQQSMPRSAVDHLNLFVQGSGTKSKRFLSLEPMHNGFYSIAFDDSFPVLEAFSTCVAYLTCQKYPETIAAKVRLDADDFAESVVGTDKKEGSTTFHIKQLPAKYTSCPPLSPAGRI